MYIHGKHNSNPFLMTFPEMGGVHHPLDVMPKNTPTRACCFRLRHRKLKTLDFRPRKQRKTPFISCPEKMRLKT